MLPFYIFCFMIPQLIGAVSEKNLAAGKGDTVVLFPNVQFDNSLGCLTLYVNGGKKSPILSAKWGLEQCREETNIFKYFMDENGNIWIHNISERDEGTYVLKTILNDNTENNTLEQKVNFFVNGKSLAAGKGETLVLFPNVAFDKSRLCLVLYLNGENINPTIRAKWGLEDCRGKMTNTKYVMDTNNNIWILNISEADGGTYVLQAMLDNNIDDDTNARKVKLIVKALADAVTATTETITSIEATTSPGFAATPKPVDVQNFIIAAIVLLYVILISMVLWYFCSKYKKRKDASRSQLKIEETTARDEASDGHPHNKQATSVDAERQPLVHHNSPDFTPPAQRKPAVNLSTLDLSKPDVSHDHQQDEVNTDVNAERPPHVNLNMQDMSTQETKMCQICFKNAIEMVLVPCGHHVACKECAVAAKTCPTCKAVKTAEVEPFNG